MNKKDKILKSFDKKFPLFIGIGSQFPIFEKTPNRNHIKQFLSKALDSMREDTIREVEEVYKGEDYERYEADITYNAYERKTGKYDVTEIVKGIKRWMRFKINKLNTK